MEDEYIQYILKWFSITQKVHEVLMFWIAHFQEQLLHMPGGGGVGKIYLFCSEEVDTVKTIVVNFIQKKTFIQTQRGDSV